MKKETVNLFGKGLNYDLNPLTTPNDVLTDCVNGTFITFNGDELILQNDAGNTKILKTKESLEDPDEYITLSPGFTPIGIKEKGGILYIVSAKSPLLNAKIWNESESYNKNEIVVIGEIYYLVTAPIIEGIIAEALLTTEKSYFLATENDTLIELDNNLSNLDILGPISIASSKLKEKGITIVEEVEFGSYPSQEVYEANTDTSTIKDITLKTPAYQVVSDKLFTAGTYVEFTNSPWTSSQNLLSTYALTDGNLTKYKRFYTIKLLQQLDNGVIDLTEDIWYKYLTDYPQNSDNPYNSWLNINTPFKYYCPNNYKGKLLLYPEIETLDQFEVTSANIIINSTGTKSLRVSAIVTNTNTSWAISPILRFYSNKNAEWETCFTTSAGPTYTWDVEISSGISILYYQVYVVVSHRVPGKPDNNINPVSPETLEGVPTEFVNTLIKNGTLLTKMGVKDINISVKTSQLNCYLIEGTWYQIYKKIFITNLEGQYIDPREGYEQANPITDINEAYYVSYEVDAGPKCVGRFTVGSDNKVANVISWAIYLNNSNTIVELLQNTIVKFESPSCGGVLLSLLPDGLSHRWGNLSVNIKQGNDILYSDLMRNPINVNALTNVPITLNVSESDLFYPIVNKSFVITKPTSLKIAPILKFKVETRFVDVVGNPDLSESIDELVINTDISGGFEMRVSVNGGAVAHREYDISRGDEPVDQVRIFLFNYGVEEVVERRHYDITVISGDNVINLGYVNLNENDTFKSHTFIYDALITKQQYSLDTEISSYNN